MPFFSNFFFSKAGPLVELGKQRPIHADDVIAIPENLGANNKTNDTSLLNWSNGKALYFSVLKFNKKLFTQIIILQLIASLFNLATPVVLNKVMTKLQSISINDFYWENEHFRSILIFATLLGICSLIYGTVLQQYFYKCISFFQISAQAIEKKIYSHALRMTNRSKQKYQIGDIVNFMNSDAESVGNCAITTVDMCNAILVIVVGTGILFYYMGWSAIVALAVMVILGPVLQKVGKRFMHLEETMMAYRDKRMTLLAQAVNAIRVVKYFSWEKSVQKEVDAIREQEIQARLKLIKEEILWSLLFASVSTVVLFSALLVHYLRGKEITLPLVMTCISTFSLMEMQFGGLSRFMNQFMNIFVSGRRITDYLKSETLESYHHKATYTDGSFLEIKNLDFGFEENQKVLKDFNFKINEGESVAVIGPVGSGKSVLLQMILGELEFSKGQILSPKNWETSLVTQDAFIINASLRENITFGKTDISEQQIALAIELAGLAPDIALLPHGLDTEIGEKGVNLSGGQKQRVTLARTVIANPNLILLDDPLSAVDLKTESYLVNKLIFGHWKNKTKIVVTHRLAFLEKFDKILFLDNGSYSFGSFEELKNNFKDFQDYLNLEERNQKIESGMALQTTAAAAPADSSDVSSRITVDEDKASGRVKIAVFKSYIKALGGYGSSQKWVLLGLLACTLASVFSPVVQNWWLTKKSGVVSEQVLVYGYGLLGVVTLLITYVYTLVWSYQGVVAGKLFHDRALHSVLHTHIRFFDSTPVGRILQRFSRDVESVDIHLQWTFENTVRALVYVTVSFFLILITLPISIITMLPLVTYYYFLQKNYRTVAREVKRYDSIARSPKYAHFKETLQGLQVIRAFNKPIWFYQEFLKKMQKSAQAYYNHYYLNRWFSVRLPIVGSMIALGTLYSVIFSTYKGWISAGLSGLVIIYSLEFWKHLNWGVRVFSDLEARMTSVERLEFYSELEGETEFAEGVKGLQGLSAKPETGDLVFKHVKLRYADHLPYVLKDVSFHIPSGNKAGIIGRTGSGKSTLFQAVYRFVHFDEGDILIDGKSIRDYSLENLRKSLAVIPQDPSLFMGTLRSNLDRYNEKTDAEIHDVLNQMGLVDFVKQLPGGLDYAIAENGSNLSQGQRQLICLARALLLKVKIIFLDEATASVDLETDQRIQNVIRSSLNGATLVTIAHRLATLDGYDQIIELQDGKVVKIENLVKDNSIS